QHNTTQHNTTQHNTTQHNTTQHNTTQHNTTQPSNLIFLFFNKINLYFLAIKTYSHNIIFINIEKHYLLISYIKIININILGE
ncbi:hypothetical protein, partial [Brachyspira innocens]|uniref:hypothetical protein n=1 Tax=Brachyspira innocens TaxID=13264 RepID=UPI001B7FEC7B